MRLIQYQFVRVFCMVTCIVLSLSLKAQRGGGGGGGNPCNSISASAVATESRCRSTGTITVTASGGSGQFNYRASGPVTTSYTSSNVISGLPPGRYDVDVYDLVNNCLRVVRNIDITGSYTDPRFSLLVVSETCKNARNGAISVTGLTGGRSPFRFTIVAAPDSAYLGRNNATGAFNNLAPGEYTIQMEDSCSGLQTRKAAVLPYDWSIRSSGGTRTACDSASLFLAVQDNRGRRSGQPGDSVFSSFRYGWVRGAADTAWFTNDSFNVHIGTRRSLTLVVRDGCGNVAAAAWAVNPKPTISASIQTSQIGCNEFTAQVTGSANLSNPSYCLFNSSNVQVQCSPTGQFSGFPAGSYTVRVRDNCYDTTITVPFSVAQPIPAINGSVNTVRATCTTFNATVTGLVNFTGPRFCLYQGTTQISCNTDGSFTGIPNGSYRLEVRDSCYDTTIVRTVTVLPLVPSVSSTVSVTNHQCTTFDAAVTGQTNLTDPVYSLWQGTDSITANTSGIFTSVPYGQYCIRIRNNPACYDTTIVVCFTGARIPPSVGEAMTIVRKCNEVDVSVNNQNQLYNPQYCLYDVNNVQIRCNTDGVFRDIPYGTYCVRITNDPNCYDTTIVRCVTIQKLPPELGDVAISDRECGDFTATLGGSNLFNPKYTLISGAGNRLDSNGSGRFTNVPYGSYCIEMKNDPACYDTTINRCFTATRPVPSGGSVALSNLTCPGFTATVSGLVNFNDPTYILKNASGTTVQTNTNGIFNVTGYGSYSIEVRNNPLCYDTTIVFNINPVQPAPSVGTVLVSNQTCTGFNAVLQGLSGLTNPVFNVLNASNNVVATGVSGSFSNLPYGSYTMQVVDGCWPTPFLVPFSETRPVLAVTDSVFAGCEIGRTNISVNITSGRSPFVVTVFDPLNNAVANEVTNGNSVTITDLPALAAGLQYRVLVIDDCGQSSSRLITPVLSNITRSINVIQQCPTGLLPNGSSDIVVSVNSNLGEVVPVIIKVDNRNETINFTIQTGNQFRFNELGPATYVVQYDLPGGCSNKLYDTVVVRAYEYPNLDNSAVYQCSNNSFSVGTEMVGGTAPYQYQIIGSSPDIPSINTGWQSSPVFTINNGQAYTLVRLRAIDACGNASLSDASVLPLENILVQANSTCLNSNVTLTATDIANGEYTWYKRVGSDSVQVGTGQTYNISSLSPADTGVYVVVVSVNNGCLTRTTTFHVVGNCVVLPVSKLELSGRKSGKVAELTWDAVGEKNVVEYVLERSTSQGNGFQVIGKLPAKAAAPANRYSLTDGQPASGNNFYRVRAVDRDGKIVYSNTIALNWNSNNLVIYPVPARDVVNLVFSNAFSKDYRIQLFTISGQVLQEKTAQRVQQATIQLHRRNMPPGMYLIRITDMATGTVQTEKIMFE